ncbi:hypothetical protein P4V43_28890 [Brevibacillus fortis]|uniref:Uncharacterized protein n=1 Tax=Brevibacillus fortis TaxID=2126352 RepID=A0A2P7V734_9BACL|nr:hypothetical protein [Brevibacillus fortis]MED1785823.1 hypothetical protein [Brevibacillus fortis]PSJ95013.1 hypothetical protein C7R93_13385 [Brevibacillus fortis]
MLYFFASCLLVSFVIGFIFIFKFHKNNKPKFFVATFLTVAVSSLFGLGLHHAVLDRNADMITKAIESKGGSVINMSIIHDGRQSKTYEVIYQLNGKEILTQFRIKDAVNLEHIEELSVTD